MREAAAQDILVVDDDEDIRDVIAMALGAMGYSVATAADGLDAIHLLSGGKRPSLILLDLMMPRMDGEAFLAALREDPALTGIPVILISGHEGVRRKAAELRADACLVKPIELHELSAVIRRLVGRRA